MSKAGKKKYESQRYVPYAKGFRNPSETDKISAIGFQGKVVPKEFKDEKLKFFKNIPQPTSIDDWLAQYDEEGQTYLQYLQECPWLSSRKVKGMHQKFVSSGKNLLSKYPSGKIYIVPVGDFDEKEFVSFQSIVDYTERFLGLPVLTLPTIKVKQERDKVKWLDEPFNKVHSRTSPRTRITNLDSRFDSKSGNLQIQINPLLFKLRQKIPEDALCLIGLTQYDLYADEPDLFVAGMAAGNHKVAVFSLNRYDPCLEFSKEYWFERQKISGFTPKDRKKLILQRSCKLVVHEICHILGIDHCIFYDCCMNGSGHLAEDFQQPMFLCPVDLHKLQTLCGFDIKKRYKHLQEFYVNFELKEEASWIEKRLKFLENK